MKEYLIVYSYAEEHYNFDNDKDCIPNIDNEIVEANNKKEAMNNFFEYRYRGKYTILNIICLGDKE